jgi:hypothetical protein
MCRYRDTMRLQRGADHLHKLGPRATAEFLAELASRIGGGPAISALLYEFERRLTPEMLAVTGGDRFPASPVRAVPQGLRT